MESGWQPANQHERDMLAAVEASDGMRYGQLLKSSILYVPTLSEGSAETRPQTLPKANLNEVVAFTSPVTLFWVLGGLASRYESYDLAGLRERYPDPGCQLVVNPGLPIGVLVPLSDVEKLAAGEQDLVPVDDVLDAAVDGALAEVRRMCLEELGGDEDLAAAAINEDSANELELGLMVAVADLDFDSFLSALVDSDVVVPTSRPVADPRQIADSGFPWWIVRGADTPVIPVFSSTHVLDRVASVNPPWIRVPFLDVLNNWPGAQHVLCVNPGTSAELTLPGTAVLELQSSIGDAPDEA